ncbi:MAG TPA: hypothetical protein VGH84_13005, partial [Steroidobacteraceae bacterium]
MGATPPWHGSGPLILFVDNGWTAAHAWSDRETAMSDALGSAARAGRPVAIVPTATAPAITLLDAGKAMRTARDLAPEPWLPDRSPAVASLGKTHFAGAPQILWLSDGLDYGDSNKVVQALGKLGHLTIFADPVGKVPLALKPEANQADGFKVTVIRAGGTGERQGDVLALGDRGETLATAPFRFARGANTTAAKLRLPLEVRNETQRIAIANEDSAGGVRLLDVGSKRRAVGL